jgi:hypothetical protein
LPHGKTKQRRQTGQENSIPRYAELFSTRRITLHQGDFGSAGVVVLRVYKTFSVDCALKFIVTEPTKAGSVRILDREGEAAELLHLAADRTAAEAWLAAHRHPDAVLEDVTTDEVGAAVIEGRAA